MKISIDYLPLDIVKNSIYLEKFIYKNRTSNYYWSNDFSAEYYISTAKAGFISVTEKVEGIELLIPEIQFSYAILDFKNLHISKKVNKLLKKENLKIEISENLDIVYDGISKLHKNNWLSKKYLNILKSTKNIDKNFKAVSVYIKKDNLIVAGELGYFIGKTYTSLSGFCLREKEYNNYGTAQLVLLAKYLEQNGFAFWNLGHPYMSYKTAIGAKVYSREDFLKRWFLAIK